RPPAREELAGGFGALLGPAPQGDDADDGGQQDHGEQPEALRRARCRHVQTAVVEEEGLADVQALPRPGQGEEYREIPEKNLQQRRNVAEDLDVDGSQLADQPVRRQPRHAQYETDDGGQHDADEGHQQGIEQTDHEHATVAVAFGVFDQVLGDTETGAVVEEREAGNDPALLQVGLGVLEEKPAERHDSDNGN